MFTGEAVPFVMELPNYRHAGRARNVGQLLWDKAKDFLAARVYRHLPGNASSSGSFRALICALPSYPIPRRALLAMIAGVIAPVFRPMGFGDWRISTALISGFMAKEERRFHADRTVRLDF